MERKKLITLQNTTRNVISLGKFHSTNDIAAITARNYILRATAPLAIGHTTEGKFISRRALLSRAKDGLNRSLKGTENLKTTLSNCIFAAEDWPSTACSWVFAQV